LERWVSKIFMDEKKGRLTQWMDFGDGKGRQVVSDLQPINSYPTRGGFNGRARSYFRQYVNLDCLKQNDTTIYLTDMMIYTDSDDNPGDEEIPPPPPPSKTFVAMALPFPYLLGKLHKLRTKLLTEEMHRKLHPLV